MVPHALKKSAKSAASSRFARCAMASSPTMQSRGARRTSTTPFWLRNTRRPCARSRAGLTSSIRSTYARLPTALPGASVIWTCVRAAGRIPSRAMVRIDLLATPETLGEIDLVMVET